MTRRAGWNGSPRGYGAVAPIFTNRLNRRIPQMRDVSALTIARGRHDHLSNVGVSGQRDHGQRAKGQAILVECDFTARELRLQR